SQRSPPRRPASAIPASSLVLLPRSVARRDLPSFPTRRSSDLGAAAGAGGGGGGGPQAENAPLTTESRMRLGIWREDKEKGRGIQDRKSTRLNSSHVSTSYAVFCLKKKTKAKRPSGRHTQTRVW